MKPLVSILIPAYQVELYLDRCLQSVRQQTYENVEVIILDDGSTDKTKDIAMQYATTFSNRFFYLRDKHRGVSNARQHLISLARGEYVFFLDADDYLDKYTIEILVDVATHYSADIVQSDVYLTESSEIASIEYNNAQIHSYTSDQAVDALQCGNDRLRCMMWAKLYKSSLFREIIFPIGKIHEDEAVMHRLMGKSNKIVNISLPLYYYFRNPFGIMNKEFSYDRYDILDAIDDRISFCNSKGLMFSAQMCCLRYCIECMALYQQTANNINESDENLEFLHRKFNSKVNSALKIIYLDDDVRQILREWGRLPQNIMIPNYWSISERYFKKYRSER